MLKHKWLRQLLGKFLLVVLGVFMALILAEFGARLWGPPFDPKEDILGSLHQCDRLIGWRGIPHLSTIFNTDGQYEHSVVWNSNGMHDQEHPLEKEKGTFRILLLGDSFAQALEVEEKQTSHQILEETLNALSSNIRFEVINGGILAWGPAQELMYFRSEGGQYRPDLVLALWVPANDLSNILPDHVFTADGVNCYAPYFVRCNGQFDPEPWFSVPGLRPAWQKCSPGQKMVTTFLSQVYAHSRLYQYLGPVLAHRNQKIDYASSYAPWVDQGQEDSVLNEAYQLTADIYFQLATEAKRIGAQTGLVIVPFKQVVYYEVNPMFRAGLLAEVPILEQANATLPNQTFLDLMTARNLPVLDLHPFFIDHYKNGGEPLHWDINFHWNVAGNRLVGEVIANWLIEQGLVPLER